MKKVKDWDRTCCSVQCAIRKIYKNNDEKKY